ncbi:MAG: sensor histidine kinase [Bacteroidota bacterium]
MSVILIVFFLLAGLYALMLYKYDFVPKAIAFESISFLLTHSFFALILNRIHKFYHSRSAISIVHLSTVIFFSLVYIFLIYEYANLFYEDHSQYGSYVRYSFPLRCILSFLLLLSVANQFWIDKHLLDEDKRNQVMIENEKRLIHSELDKLKQQFQPHFLFNSLNSISALIGSQPAEARRMILLLSDFLRLSIRKREQDLASLDQELEFLELYLEIEKVRFGHRLEVKMNVDPALEEEQIPAQILQPLVENAIKYGLYGNLGQLTIGVDIQRDENLLRMQITNPYEENAVNASKGTGYGLRSVEQKLKILYGRSDLIRIQKAGGQFEITLSIPLAKEPLLPLERDRGGGQSE